MQFREMLRPSPAEQGTGRALTADAVRTLFDCAQACTACAGSCLSEERITSLRRRVQVVDLYTPTAALMLTHQLQ